MPKLLYQKSYPSRLPVGIEWNRYKVHMKTCQSNLSMLLSGQLITYGDGRRGMGFGREIQGKGCVSQEEVHSR